MRRHQTYCLICLALLAGSAGCGASGDRKSNSELLRAALFKPADLPKGWSSEPLIHDRRCGGDPTRAAVGNSASHLGAGFADIQQKVTVFKSEGAAKEAYRGLGSHRGVACFRSIVQHATTSYSGGALLKPLTVLHRAEGGGVLVRRMTLTVASAIGPANIYVDDIKGQLGRGVITVKISSGLAPVPGSSYKRVLEVTKQRLQQMGDG